MSIVKPGRYTAFVKEHAITETREGLPQATIVFEFEFEGATRELTWFGSFKEGALDHTIKALVVCGLDGANPAGPLEIGRKVSIVIEVEKDQEGKDRNKVRWVNKAGGIAKPMDSSEAKAKLERFSGLVMKAKQTLDGGVEQKKDPNKDLPF
jgi:hypothetical protein